MLFHFLLRDRSIFLSVCARLKLLGSVVEEDQEIRGVVLSLIYLLPLFIYCTINIDPECIWLLSINTFFQFQIDLNLMKNLI